MAVIGALGVSVVTHWEEILMVLRSIAILLPEQYHQMFPPEPRTGGPSIYSDDEILYLSINGHPYVVVKDELAQPPNLVYEPVFRKGWVEELLRPYTPREDKPLPFEGSEDLTWEGSEELIWDFDFGERERASLHEAGHAVAAWHLRTSKRKPFLHVCIHPQRRDSNGHIIGCTSLLISDFDQLSKITIMTAGLFVQNDGEWTEAAWPRAWELNNDDTTYLDDLHQVNDLLSPHRSEERRRLLNEALCNLQRLFGDRSDAEKIAQLLQEQEILSFDEIVSALRKAERRRSGG